MTKNRIAKIARIKRGSAKGFDWDNGTVAFGDSRKKGVKYVRDQRHLKKSQVLSLETDNVKL